MPGRKPLKVTPADHFPELTPVQRDQLFSLAPLYREWNAKINIISRKDIDELETHHILHSLAIARIITFLPGTRIMDAGTGGGFPGIPLAIMFPEVEFILVDSIGKKIKVVEAVAANIGLTNVKAIHGRMEQINGPFDFVTGRAVATLAEFIGWIKPKVARNSFNTLPNGLIYLKGGDLTGELKAVKSPCRIFEISQFFSEPYFETKKIVHVTLV